MAIDVTRISNHLAKPNGRTSETPKNTEVKRTSPIHDHPGGSLSYGRFVKGQIFRGQISNISPSEITIELANGDTVTARYDNKEELCIGDDARFQVIERDETLITLKTLFSPESNMDQAVFRALEASGLPFSQKNEEIVSSLLKYELPANKQMIGLILKQSLDNPNISMSNLVLMNKAGLPVDPVMSKMFESYSGIRESFADAVSRNSEELLNLLQGLARSEGGDVAGALASDFLTVFHSGLEADRYVLSDLSVRSFSPPETLHDFTELIGELLSSPPPGHESIGEDPLSSLFNERERLLLFSLFESTSVDAENLQNLISGRMTFTDFSTFLERELPFVNGEKEIPEFLKNFPYRPTGDFLPEKLLSLLPREAGLPEAAEAMSKLLSSASLSSEEKSSLLLSSDFKKTLYALFKRNLTLSPEEVGERDGVRDFYRRMAVQAEELSRLLQKTGIERSSLGDSFTHTKENLEFLNRLAGMYRFIELPLRLTGGNATGDLYVYSDKSRKKNANEDTISCLLHLDLASLGSMNIRIELSENTVSSKFFLEDKESLSLLSSHIHELDALLRKQGFHPKSELRGKEGDEETVSFSLVNDFIPNEIEKSHFTRYSFDVRA